MVNLSGALLAEEYTLADQTGNPENLYRQAIQRFNGTQNVITAM